MDRVQLKVSRRRLSAPNDDLYAELHPVQKVEVHNPGLVYYIPVEDFPIPKVERHALHGFIRELLKAHAKSTGGRLFNSMGVLSSVLRDELLQSLVENSFDWRPQSVLALFPGQAPPHMPGKEEREQLKQNFSVEKLHEFVPLLVHVSREAAVDKAFETAFGWGGAAFYVSTLEPAVLLKKARQVFGYNITEPAYKSMDCLPFFAMPPLLYAAASQFKALYSTLSLYIGESIADRGIVIISGVSLDESIADLARLLRPDSRSSK